MKFLLFLVALSCHVRSMWCVENFKKLKDSDTCLFTQDDRSLPNCTLNRLVENSTSTDEIVTTCISPGVLRIQGDYGLLKLTCKANYGLDFFYIGNQPTEAIQVNWWKSVVPGSSGKNLTFNLELNIRSVNNLFEYYTAIEPHRNHTKHVYTRSGEYSVQAVYDNTTKRSFFLYLEEDNVTPTILRNQRLSTPIKIIKVPEKPNEYIADLPCVSSHAEANISSVISTEEISQVATTSGIRVQFVTEALESVVFKCVLTLGNITDEVLLSNQNGFEFYGLENYKNQTIKGDAVVDFTSSIDANSTLHIQPWCRVSNLNANNLWLATVPSDNFGNLRLVREFVLPEFAENSYTVRKGSATVELSREIRTSEEDELSSRFGTTFCVSRNEHRLVEYGTSHGNGAVVKIPYGMDWTFLPRDFAPIHIFLNLRILPQSYLNGQLFANTVLAFACRIHEAVMVQPVIWYTQFINGSTNEEKVDYNLIGPFSYFHKNVTSDISMVYCSATFWYKELWRNISVPVSLTEGQLPTIVTNKTLIVFGKESNNRKFLNCEAKGNPTPNISWHSQGFDISSNGIRTEGSLILDLAQFGDSSSVTGRYVCKASNLFGTTQKSYFVEIDEGSTVNYWLAVGIPLVIILVIIICVVLYVRNWQKALVGLTRAEIDEFKRGQIPSQTQQKSLSGYANDFAHTVPYSSEFEKSKYQYQIDRTAILGSGAYGTVFKGILSGIPVAIKTVKENAEKAYLKALLSELKIMIYIGNHHNIAEFLGSDTSSLHKGFVYIFVKLYNTGSLDLYLRKHRDFLNQKSDLLIQWAYGICSGMAYLETKRVIHGDLAARNILLDDELVAKVGDFGLSRQLVNYTDYVKKNQEPLPWRWMAVESLRNLTFSHKSDVWGFGVTLWEIFSLGEVPYPGFSYTLDFVTELENGLRMSKPTLCSVKTYNSILLECWQIDVNRRPTFHALSRLISQADESEQVELKVTEDNMSKSCVDPADERDYLNEFSSTDKSGNVYSNTLV